MYKLLVKHNQLVLVNHSVKSTYLYTNTNNNIAKFCTKNSLEKSIIINSKYHPDKWLYKKILKHINKQWSQAITNLDAYCKTKEILNNEKMNTAIKNNKMTDNNNNGSTLKNMIPETVRLRFRTYSQVLRQQIQYFECMYSYKKRLILENVYFRMILNGAKSGLCITRYYIIKLQNSTFYRLIKNMIKNYAEENKKAKQDRIQCETEIRNTKGIVEKSQKCEKK